MQDQAGSKRKVVITDDNNEAIFSLNSQSEPHTLDIQCKELQSCAQLWGSFKLSDLEPHYQAIFDRIDSLYHYISEKSEEVEIEDRCVKIMLNFLKQSKVIRLELSEMVRCSADAQRKILERVRVLETQNKTLVSALRDQGNGQNYQKYQKLTLPLLMEAINFDSYKVTNFREVSPVPNNYLRSLMKLHPAVTLPQTGLWSFQFTATSFIRDSYAKAAPQIQIGIKDDQSEAVVVTLNSSQGYSFGIDGKSDQGEGGLHENDYIRVVLNMDARILAVVKNFSESDPRFLSWQALRGTKLWLSLRLYMVCIKTDLFVEQKPIDWQRCPCPCPGQ